MFDDLRNSDQPIFQGEEVNKPQPVFKSAGSVSSPKKKNKKFLGMTAFQRFVVSTLLFLLVCMAGIAVLFVTGRMAIF
ncbi:MAG: hypothetical protein DDG60_13585 [Anaerolineae bacterium]|nr:MAG: hypothetical protein DDG60_13585 [Anaerolineae bacterium]